MNIKELIEKLEDLGKEIGFDSEVWVASNYITEPLYDVSECVDMDTNISHVQLASHWPTRGRHEKFES